MTDILITLLGMIATLIGALLTMHANADAEHRKAAKDRMDAQDAELLRLRKRMHDWASIIGWARTKARLDIERDEEN